MLNDIQKRRVQSSKMITISNLTYPNIYDAIRFYCGFSGIAEQEIPQAVKVSMNVVYLERLEEFLKDEVDLPGFYAFVEGRNGTFRDFTGFPMADIAMEFIAETLQGGNNDETVTHHYHDRAYRSRFNRFGSSLGNGGEPRIQQSEEEPKQENYHQPESDLD